jgi:hypothetical protein
MVPRPIDGTCRIRPASNKKLPSVSSGHNTPTLAEFDEELIRKYLVSKDVQEFKSVKNYQKGEWLMLLEIMNIDLKEKWAS